MTRPSSSRSSRSRIKFFTSDFDTDLEGIPVHLLIGFVNVILGRTMASIYRLTHLEFFGRAAIRRCCAAFIAGAGIDDEAMAIIRSMGADGLRLLECEAQSAGERSIAQFVWNILRSLP